MKQKKNLLIDEYPLIVLPSLAKAIGLNEAIALQQLHYWLNNPKGGVEMDGERWVYNTYEEWQADNFTFWSVRTVMRTFANLEEMGLVISMQKASYDRKKYYRVHYDNLSQWNMPDCQDASRQNGAIDGAKVAACLTETTTETTTEREEADAKIFEALSEMTGGGLNSNTPKFVDGWRERHSWKCILRAITVAIQNKARSIKYVDEILTNWDTKGHPKEKRNGKTNAADAITQYGIQQGFMEA